MSVYATIEFTADLFTYIILLVGRRKSNIIKSHLVCIYYFRTDVLFFVYLDS